LELIDYFEILRRRKSIILITTAVTLMVIMMTTFMTAPVYLASTILRVASSTVTSSSYSEYVYSERLLNTYARIAASRPVADELVNRLSLEQLPRIKVEILPNTELIQISVEAESPDLALKSANTLADLLVEEGKTLYSGGRKSTEAILSEKLHLAEVELIQARSELERVLSEFPENSQVIDDARQSLLLQQEIYGAILEQYEQATVRETIRANMISIIEPAILPQAPVRPRPALNLTIGLVAGLMGGISLGFLMDHLGTGGTKTRLVETRQAEHAS
jgi:capsular polysaccharide biosynthesis protein